MPSDHATTAYLSRFGADEDEPLRAARARSEENDIPTVSAHTGALLRFLAALTSARSLVEVGSGGGYSGLWLMQGADPRATLTTIESEREHQALAQRAYTEGGCANRVRSITGTALSVLPKLADAGYDLVFLDAAPAEYPEYLTHARRLLRPGGLLVADGVLAGGVTAAEDGTGEDADALRAFNEAVSDDPDLVEVLVDVGAGVLAAVHRPGDNAA